MGGFSLLSTIHKWRLLTLVIVLVGTFALRPSEVAANDDGYLDIKIYEAYYTDYDGDGYEDDIITIFAIFAQMQILLPLLLTNTKLRL